MTLMRRARKGIIPEIEAISKAEGKPPKKLQSLVLEGRVIIPSNPIHSPEPLGIGEGLRVKINANIGTSQDHHDLKEELEKAAVAVEYGADTIMDLSTGGDIDEVRRMMVKEVRVPIGSVPIYQAALKAAKNGSILDMTEDDMFSGIELHAKDGIDFMTVHCGVTKESVRSIKDSVRITDIVSRGGIFLASWILHRGEENPLYSNFDYLLEMAQEYDFALSLGDGLRPGCIADATDGPQLQELLIIGELVRRARDRDVQVIVEGPGHVPLNQIEANVRVEKTVCEGAPFYVLGPIVTDIAPGYDHITGAIGGALAAFYGADFLCYVTPAEHLALPTVEDVKEGVVSSRIAAHAADVARGRNLEQDNDMARARKALDWEKMLGTAVDPEKARLYRKRRKPKDDEVCSMCGDVCAIKIASDFIR
ncbi:MAG: phosphomethylpyrimidine synthase ThiC [Thermoplasmata archaeon]